MKALLALGLTAAAIATSCGGVGGEAAVPERIVSLRQRVLPRERYAELETEWKAYTVTHPRDPLGWAELAKAARYAGKSCDEYVPYAEKAVSLGPQHAGALATLGAFKWSMWCDGQPAQPDEAIRLLERAVKLDPTLDEPRYTLWTMRLAKGDKAGAAAELRAVLDAGRMPEPLLDFGYNMLVGLEPNAILLTNGDNDTYPLVALQSCRGVREDVAVVNLSMLNLPWYRRDLTRLRPPVPVPLLDQSPSSATEGPAALAGLIENLGDGRGQRPLYVACSVSLDGHSIPRRLSLEGLVYRVRPGEGFEVDTQRVARNLATVYRLESATSPSLDWKAWSSVGTMMRNYVAADLQLATAYHKAGNLAGVARSMNRALSLCERHGPEYVDELIGMWAGWDPKSRELARWRKKTGK
jgi:tetratricopeptide (TPR) repeat protein